LPVPRRLANADERITSCRQCTQSCVPRLDAGPCFLTPTLISPVYNVYVALWFW